jgi:hypothetical protein
LGARVLERVPKTRQRWSFTGEAFEALLDRLSPEREQAALQFEEHRRYLITLLTYAGAVDPEHLADTTLDRAAKRLSDGEAIDNIRAMAPRSGPNGVVGIANRDPPGSKRSRRGGADG